jgi:transcriptional regulator
VHPNPAYRKESRERNVEFVRQRSFGILSVCAPGGPLLSHIPFQLSQDASMLEAHLVRSNPIVRALGEPLPAVMAVSGGDCYVSPDWYGIDNQVPTWNYVAVHLRGVLSTLHRDALHGILERLSADMEGRLAGKAPWNIDKMDAQVYAKLQRQIIPVSMQVDDIQGTWKLSQNKPESARLGAANGVSDFAVGFETDSIAKLMRDAE